MTPKQKLTVLLGVIGFIVVGVYIYREKKYGPQLMRERARKQTEKHLQRLLKPAIQGLKSTGSTKLGGFELEGNHAGSTNFTDVTLTRKTGNVVEVKYQAKTMKITYNGSPMAILKDGKEIRYEGGREKETTPFSEKKLALRSA